MRSFIMPLAVAILLMFPVASALSAKCGNKCPTCPADVLKQKVCPPPPKTTYHPCPSCCQNMGGVQYCDKSSGRFICNNGYISSCYCSRDAVMNLQKIQGCCLWQGGVMAVDDDGLVICNNGGISEECSLHNAIAQTHHH